MHAILKRRATEHELEQSEREKEEEREDGRNGEIHKRGKIAHERGYI